MCMSFERVAALFFFMLPFVWFHPLAEVFIYGIAKVRLLTSSIVFLVCAIDDDGASKFMGGNT